MRPIVRGREFWQYPPWFGFVIGWLAMVYAAWGWIGNLTLARDLFGSWQERSEQYGFILAICLTLWIPLARLLLGKRWLALARALFLALALGTWLGWSAPMAHEGRGGTTRRIGPKVYVVEFLRAGAPPFYFEEVIREYDEERDGPFTGTFWDE